MRTGVNELFLIIFLISLLVTAVFNILKRFKEKRDFNIRITTEKEDMELYLLTQNCGIRDIIDFNINYIKNNNNKEANHIIYNKKTMFTEIPKQSSPQKVSIGIGLNNSVPDKVNVSWRDNQNKLYSRTIKVNKIYNHKRLKCKDMKR